jgi:hypothetical protein
MWSRGRGSLSGPLRLNETEDAQVTTLVLALLQLSSGLNVSLWEFDPFREEARRIVQGR